MKSLAIALVVALAACTERSSADEADDVQACDFDAAVDGIADESSATPVDCGFVDRDDPLDAWQQAESCAVDAIANGTPMLIRWKPQVIDGLSIQAIVAASDPFSLTWVHYSGYDDESIGSYTCEMIATQSNCTVAVGQMCFDCIGLGMDVDICP